MSADNVNLNVRVDVDGISEIETLNVEMGRTAVMAEALGRAGQRLSSRLDSTTASHKRLGKVVDGLLNAFGRFMSLLGKGFAISLAATSAALVAVKAAFVVGRVAVKGYHLALMGLSAGIATAAAGLYALAAAQREYAAATAQFRYAPNGTGGRRGAADAAIRSLTSNRNLAIAGNENLMSAFTAVSQQTTLTPQLTKALEGLGDFVATTGDFAALADGGAFLGGLVKAKGLTDALVEDASKLGPEFVDAMKQLQKEGKTSVNDVLGALTSGSAAASVGVQGALLSVNQTLFGAFKSNFQQLRDLAADLGMGFLKPATTSVNSIGQTLRSAMIRSSYAVNAFAKSSLFDSVNSAVEKLANWSVRLVENYLPKAEGFFGRLQSTMRSIGQWFAHLVDQMRPLEEAGQIIIDFLMIPIREVFGGYGDGLKTFSTLVKENRAELMNFGEGLARFIDAVSSLFGALKQAFMDALPALTAIADAFKTVVHALRGLKPIFQTLLGKNLGGLATIAAFFAAPKLTKMGGKALLGKSFFGGKGRGGLTGAAGRSLGGGMSSTSVMNVTAGTVNVSGGLPGDGGPSGEPGAPGGGPTRAQIQNARRQARARAAARKAFGLSAGVMVGSSLVGGAIGGDVGQNVQNIGGTTGSVGMMASALPGAGVVAPIAMAGIGSALAGNAIGRASGSGTTGMLGGAGSGALMGAAAGAMVGGPVGAAVGAIGGAIVGGVSGWISGNAESQKRLHEAAQAIVNGIMGDVSKAVALGRKRQFLKGYQRVGDRMIEEFESGNFKKGAALAEQVEEYGSDGKVGRAMIQAEKHTTRLAQITGKSKKEIQELANKLGIDLSKSMKSLKKYIDDITGIKIWKNRKDMLAGSRDSWQTAMDATFRSTVTAAETRKAVNEGGITLAGLMASGEAKPIDFAQYGEQVSAYEFATAGGDMLQALVNMTQKLNTTGPMSMFNEGRQFAGQEEAWNKAGGKEQTEAFYKAALAENITEISTNLADAKGYDQQKLAQALNDKIVEFVNRGDFTGAAQALKTVRDSRWETGKPDLLRNGKMSDPTGDALQSLGISTEPLKASVDAVDKAGKRVANVLNRLGNLNPKVRGKIRGMLSVNIKDKKGRNIVEGDVEADGNLGSDGGGGGSSSLSEYEKDLLAQAGINVNDTATMRRNRVGDTASRWGGSLATHLRLTSMLGGKRQITSGVRFDRLGSPSSDHTTGAAFDLIGDNLGAYADLVRAEGGFAEFHGAAGTRHLHVVPGTGAMGDMANPTPTTGGGGAVAQHTYYLTVNPAPNASAEEIAEAVMVKIERKQRSEMERM